MDCKETAKDPTGLPSQVLTSHPPSNLASTVGERRGPTQLTHVVATIPVQQGPETGPKERISCIAALGTTRSNDTH